MSRRKPPKRTRTASKGPKSAEGCGPRAQQGPAPAWTAKDWVRAVLVALMATGLVTVGVLASCHTNPIKR